jgi:hypothetical protein
MARTASRKLVGVLLRLAVPLAALSGCAHGKVDSAAEAKAAAARVRTFEQLEDEILRDLATIDRRIAARARVTPSEDDLRRVALGGLLQEDPTLAVAFGTIDPFSFDARARGLEGTKKKITQLPANLPQSADGMTPAPAFERELLLALVAEEALRLEEERSLPRSASALVRAIVDTWRAPSTPEEAAEAERWLARRLRELAATLKKDATNDDPTTALDVVRARELDDALDALERLIGSPGFTKATQELVRVREALEAQSSRPAAKVHSEWAVVARRARAHLGLSAPPEALERDLVALEARLRAQAEPAIAAGRLDREALASRLSAVVFAPGDCVDAVPGSRVRSMAPPPERSAACHIRQMVGNAGDDAARAIMLAAMHDHVVVALWALAVARGTASIGQAQAKHRFVQPASPDLVARYERIALARPVMALGAGEAVRILELGGDPPAKAKAWSRLGDVPLDVAARELGGRAPDKAPEKPSRPR